MNEPHVDPMWGRRLSRRDVLRMTGRGSVGLAAAAALAACGASNSSGTSAASSAKVTMPPLAHELVIAQWPLYIDPGKNHAESPTLVAFTKDTGIHVAYREVIEGNSEFFGKLVPEFQGGQDTGYDLITLSDWVVTKLDRAGWIEALDWSLLPTVKANLGPSFVNPPYDPNNAHSVPWQGGITGIAYNPRFTGRRLTKFADLWDPAFKGHVGMLTEMVDTMNLTLLSLGIKPETATVDDAKKAQAKLIDQRDAGLVRNYYGQDYTNAFQNADTWATMAWSGDVFQLKLTDPSLEFVVPEEGGILWATPMEIPNGAQHPTDAHAFLDYVYRPEVAAQITEWVAYVTPVSGTQDVIAKHAKQATSSKDRSYLETLAASPLVFPTDEMRSNLYTYKVLSADEETQWNNLFTAVINS